MKKRTKKLSIVVPTYRQEKTIETDIKSIAGVIAKLNIDYEIIVVVDGVVDNSHLKLKKINNKEIKIIIFDENQGKGKAVCEGVLSASGDVIGFIDGGMDINPKEIEQMLEIMISNNADIVIGSKLHPDSKVSYPLSRRILSWGYRTLTHMLFGFNVKDTQVGLKLFKRKVARDVFSRILVKRFAFDVEVLAVAYKLGYTRIVEAPIILDFTGVSSITSKSFWRVIGWMLWDTAAVYYRLRILHYYDKK